ncbi:MAG: amidohydrolase family protein [Dehalococcoidia bacterium]
MQTIDFHIHPPGPGGLSTEEQAQMAAYFRGGPPPASSEEMAEYYQRLGIFGVLFAIDTETATGRAPVPNDYIADCVRRWPQTFAGFGTVDPWKGKAAVREAERVADLGLKGLKFHPSTQEFYPNERRFYALWETAQRLGLIVLFHTGPPGGGGGRPGGGGVKLGYARPIPYMDDVAADFPELTVVMAHPSWPWQEEQLAMLVHKPNVYMDLSGWSPKYFSPSLITYANNLVSDKVLFGSDYPAITPERWLRDFEQAPFADAVRPKILHDNAARLLGL